MSEVISPCPFCGSEYTDPTTRNVDGKHQAAVECGQCGARGPIMKWPGGEDGVPSKHVIRAWNRRP